MSICAASLLVIKDKKLLVRKDKLSMLGALKMLHYKIHTQLQISLDDELIDKNTNSVYSVGGVVTYLLNDTLNTCSINSMSDISNDAVIIGTDKELYNISYVRSTSVIDKDLNTVFSLLVSYLQTHQYTYGRARVAYEYCMIDEVIWINDNNTLLSNISVDVQRTVYDMLEEMCDTIHVLKYLCELAYTPLYHIDILRNGYDIDLYVYDNIETIYYHTKEFLMLRDKQITGEDIDNSFYLRSN